MIGELLLPPYSLGLMSLVGLLVMNAHPKLGRGLVAASVALLVVLSFLGSCVQLAKIEYSLSTPQSSLWSTLRLP